MKEYNKDFIAEQVEALIAAPSCCNEAKAVAKAWLDARGTENEDDATAALIAELKADIIGIDGLIEFAGSPMGAQVFGEAAAAVKADAEAAKANGAKYCTCAACAACEAVLKEYGEI